VLHACWRQDAVLVPVSKPAIHSGSAYPSEVIMSRGSLTEGEEAVSR
jgi:hypothetical protein